MDSLIDLLAAHPALAAAAGRLAQGQPVRIEGLSGAARALLISTLSQDFETVLVMTATDDAARALCEDLSTLLPDAAAYCPPSDVWSPTSDAETAALRVVAHDRLRRGERVVVVGSAPAILQRTAADVERIRIQAGAELKLAAALESLGRLGYERVTLVEQPGQFAARGGIIDVFPSTEDQPIRIELFGDEVESIRRFDADTQRSVGAVPALELLPARDAGTDGDPCLLELLPPEGLAVLDEPGRVQGHWEEFKREFAERLKRHEQHPDEFLEALPSAQTYATWDDVLTRIRGGRRAYLQSLPRGVPWEPGLDADAAVDDDEAVRRAPPGPADDRIVTVRQLPLERFDGRIPAFAEAARLHLKDGLRCAVVSEQFSRLAHLMGEHSLPVEPGGFTEPGALQLLKGRLSAGFMLPEVGLWLAADTEIFGARQQLRPRRHFKSGSPILSLLELNEGDFVVHINQGIGVYRGVTRLQQEGGERDFLQIDYAEADRLYVPTDQLDRVQKYVGAGQSSAPTITRLGGTDWKRTTSRVKAAVQEMARDLLQLYAARNAAERPHYGPDTVEQREMEESFPYRETGDQMRAIDEVKHDLESQRPMDRLVCGDVGYGKTEVAVRAAFKVADSGRQVAVLTPTTILAQQHLNTFRERMSGFPIRVEMLSRFCTAGERADALRGLRDGSVNVVVGTHALLAKSVEFANLGMVIVDEEQRFGVRHKERLKELRRSVDVLTLSATPIPRTLHMSLAGIRDMSVINQPPEGRAAIRTVLAESTEGLIRRAILRELDRGGQVYFVYNRVERIEHMASRIEKLVPEASIGVAHGQMPERLLEQVMWDFYHKKFNVLICSTIIENGLDIPNVNTILVMNSDQLGLAQLYQLRGRVGRSSRQAYCYLLYQREKALTETAQRRLEAIRDFTELGSGFKVALRDLEIRGAGNLLGSEQSGFMVSVGFELYCQMMEEAVKELKGEPVVEVMLPAVEVTVDAFIPNDYIPTEGLRIAFYKKLAAVRSLGALKQVQEEMEDRFGDPPKPVWNLMALVRVRLTCAEAGIQSVHADKRRAVFRLSKPLSRNEILLLGSHHRKWHVLADRIEVLVETNDVMGVVDDQLSVIAKILHRRRALAQKHETGGPPVAARKPAPASAGRR